jgi:nucleoside-diphosphate-sugar epimerase
MKILVTGANGFIGAWTLHRLLESGHEVHAFDVDAAGPLVRRLLCNELARIRWWQGDVSAGEGVDRACVGCDLFVHLAGVLTPFCQEEPVHGAMVNLIGTLKVFEAARRTALRKVVYASSAAVFGPRHDAFPEPITHYGAFKLACEGSARSYCREHGITSLGLRPFVVYGPGREEGASAGISLACRAAAEGRPYTIPFTGRAGMVFVDDVVDAIAAAVTTEFEGAHVLNLGGEVHSVQEVIAQIHRHHPGAQLAADGPPLPLCTEMTARDTEPVVPGLRTTSLSTGIARTLAHFH